MNRLSTPPLWTCFALIVHVAIACSRDSAHPRRESPRTSSGGRRFVRTLSDTLWVAKAAGDSGYGAPLLLAADGRAVYVGDGAAHAILALDAASGVLRWRTDDRRDSLLADVSPVLVAARRGGGVMVVDQRDRVTLTYVTADGRASRRVRLASLGDVQAVCELPDSTILVVPSEASRGLPILSRSGVVLRVLPFPWADLRGKSSLLTQLTLTPTPAGCVAALSLGRGFTRFQHGAFSEPVSYVEPVPLPALSREERPVPNGVVISTSLMDHSGAALDAAATSSALFLLFGGHTDDRNHVIDVYSLDGAYRESFRTPRAPTALAAADSTVFLLTKREGESVVVALRWPPRGRASAREGR
jgi:hypothetical protein